MSHTPRLAADEAPTAQLLPTEPVPPTSTPIPPTPTLARREFNESAAMKVAPTSFLPGRGPELPGEFVYAGRRIDVFVGRGTFAPAEVAELAAQAEHSLSYIQRRFATSLTQRVSVGVYSVSQAPGSGTRGIAYTHGATNVHIYYNSYEDKHSALVVLTHELAHALQAEAYGKDAQSRSDLVLLEGLACWITGEYWLSLSDASSFQARARSLYHAGYNGNLAGLANSSDTNAAYDMWAGFVDYLTRTYGWDRFNILYANGRGRAPGSADYMGVYGKSFRELQDEWYATLR
ncbi:MAG: hypothetical protein EI684_07210 [Candidatus Viridilinea halotolerans]|uniref:Uncharacterized protein n=1 Tax=Candidatus Viridilinea halotolerans TaxID=2491704 RepID=A0A426U3I8_9CHLR|nr:MAG: hypothetical protein EI684_07210 [Candidatus Viridilinea halotolerans]